MFHRLRLVLLLAGSMMMLTGWWSGPVSAASGREIDAGADDAIEKFEKEVNGGKGFIENSKGVLVFPRVLKGGAGFGGEYGEGAFRIKGKTVDYYSMLQGSFGFQLGGEIKTVYLVFLDEGAMNRFREGEGWKAGVDGSVSLVTWEPAVPSIRTT
jgi:lipid-binding SYLF domain-containing protein